MLHVINSNIPAGGDGELLPVLTVVHPNVLLSVCFPSLNNVLLK